MGGNPKLRAHERLQAPQKVGDLSRSSPGSNTHFTHDWLPESRLRVTLKHPQQQKEPTESRSYTTSLKMYLISAAGHRHTSLRAMLHCRTSQRTAPRLVTGHGQGRRICPGRDGLTAKVQPLALGILSDGRL